MSVKIIQNLKSLSNLEKSILLILISWKVLCLCGNHGIVCFVKYCLILEKNANYRTPLKMSIRRAIFGFTFVIECGKLKHLSPKITLLSH